VRRHICVFVITPVNVSFIRRATQLSPPPVTAAIAPCFCLCQIELTNSVESFSNPGHVSCVISRESGFWLSGAATAVSAAVVQLEIKLLTPLQCNINRISVCSNCAGRTNTTWSWMARPKESEQPEKGHNKGSPAAFAFACCILHGAVLTYDKRQRQYHNHIPIYQHTHSRSCICVWNCICVFVCLRVFPFF